MYLFIPSEHIATPTSSPEPAPSADLHPAPVTWGDAELPLDEEQPEAPLDSHSPPLCVHKQYLTGLGLIWSWSFNSIVLSFSLMSVAEEEPPLSSPPPPLPSVPPVASSPPLDSGPPSRSSSSDDSSSSSSSSAVTEAALKHISEGELLLSLNLQAALTGTDFTPSPEPVTEYPVVPTERSHRNHSNREVRRRSQVMLT